MKVMEKERWHGWNMFNYYQWLLDKVEGHREPYYDYSLLLHELHSIPFKWTIDRDGNRASDGERLRIIFMDEENIPEYYYEDARGVGCSVLEMLVGLSIRCDMEIMGEAGQNQVARWFWIMIDNLDLMKCRDECFSGEYVRQQIDIWLDRMFDRRGKGSPFPLKNKHCQDQRNVEIWFQMCGYLCENF